MRILVNAKFGTHKTGVGRVITSLISALSKIDKKNIYFIYLNKDKLTCLPDLNNNFIKLTNGIKSKNVILNHFFSSVILLIKSLLLDIDLIIIPQISFMPFKTKKMIFFQHDLAEYYIPNQKWYKLLFRRLILPRMHKLADKIIAVSNNTKKDIIKILKTEEKKIEVIYNGVDLNLFCVMDRRKSKDILREKYMINDDFILFVGEITHPQKNLINLIRSYKRYREEYESHHKLVLVGKKGKDYRIIENEIHKLGLANDVILTGYIEDFELPYFYNAASIFCFISLYEGFGLPILESMACGCPVIASNVSCMPEIAGDAAILVHPEDIENIVKSMNELIKNEDMRKALIEKGLERCRLFSWEEAAKKLLFIINNIN